MGFFAEPKPAPELFAHQIHTADFIRDNPRTFIMNDPGTGKTTSTLTAFRDLKNAGQATRMLVFAPKSILEPAWCDDCRTFTPELSITPAYAKNREKAFKASSDIVVTNHDAAKWLADHPELLAPFDVLAIDESTAYKNPNSQRSKAMLKIAKHFELRTLLTGTPIPNELADIWHQMLLLDDGERLGANFYRFRGSTHTPTLVADGIKKWIEKPGSREAVVDIIADLTVRFRFEDCVDIPANHASTRTYTLPKKAFEQYKQMERQALIELANGEVEGVNAAATAGKLLQIASGAVYDADKVTHTLDTGRYELIAELVNEVPHSLVGFQWHHQRDNLLAALKSVGITDVGVIDGTVTSGERRAALVRDFQAGNLRTILAHPKSASHGLTLTKATRIIWASPTTQAEAFEQFWRRIYRTGQTQPTETIYVQAANTIDVVRYDQLQGKLGNQTSLLDTLNALTQMLYQENAA